MVTRSCKHLSNRSKYFKVLKLIELYYLTYKRGNMTQLLGHANICSKGHCFGQLFFERWPAKVDDRVVSWKLLIGWLAFDDNSDWLWLAVDEAYLDNGQFWQGYTLSSRTSRFFYQGWSSNCLLISTKLEVLLLELSTLHLPRVCSNLVKCLWGCALQSWWEIESDALTEGCNTRQPLQMLMHGKTPAAPGML